MSKTVNIILGTLLLSITTFASTKACIGCHGNHFEKKALNVSKVVKNMSKAQIIKALKGYKNGTYGGAMKGLMKKKVVRLSNADIAKIASEIKQ
jgi:cytochrome c-type protein NapB